MRALTNTRVDFRRGAARVRQWTQAASTEPHSGPDHLPQNIQKPQMNINYHINVSVNLVLQIWAYLTRLV